MLIMLGINLPNLHASYVWGNTSNLLVASADDTLVQNRLVVDLPANMSAQDVVFAGYVEQGLVFIILKDLEDSKKRRCS
jgi:hypothetical protein